MSALDPLLRLIQRPVSAGDPGFPMSTPGGHRRNDQHVVLDPAQDFIRNTADEHALEQGESAGSDHYQIRANAACDLLDRSER